MIYQVFVAEDETRVREGIRNHLDQSGRYQLCGEAADGEIALPAILEIKPDILITDIKMPFMDGLALAGAVKRASPRTKILIISGHDEFAYAKQAISIGVDEYLLKPIRATTMLEALDKVACQLEEERTVLAAQDPDRERQKELILRDAFLDEVLTGALSVAQVLERAEQFGISIPAKQYLVAEMELNYQQALPEAALSLRSVVDCLLRDREDVLWCLRGRDRIVVVAKGEGKEKLEQTVYEVLMLLRDELSRLLGIASVSGIGTVADRMGEISTSYLDAYHLLRRFPALPKGTIVNTGDLDHGSLVQLAGGDEPMGRKLLHATAQDVESLVDQICGSQNDVGSLLYVYYRITDLVVTATRIVSESGKDAAEVFPALSQASAVLRKSDMEEIRAFTGDIIRRFIAFRDKSAGGLRYGQVIAQAKNHIYENFHDSGISLHTVATHIGFSPNHFSTIFSQNTGETFIGFLTRVRMEQAHKMLLTTDLSTSEIAFRTGYNDTNYFRYLFKKHYGYSPRELRSLHQDL
jgi:two-component system response regulator YesN